MPDPAVPTASAGPLPPAAAASLLARLADLPDPRSGPALRHRLLDVVAIAVCAVLCGADSWVEVAAYGRAKEGWLRRFLALPHGIPSHDTFGRVFAALDVAALEAVVLDWARAALGDPAGGTVAIDGKALRGSHDRANGRDRPLLLVSAWATANGLALGQEAVGDGNETTAIPALLERLDLAGATVTIDAAGCTPAIAGRIAAGGGAWALALKANQPDIHERVALHFRLAAADGWAGHALASAVDAGHGRVERRTCVACGDPAVLAWVDPEGRWPGLASVAMVVGERTVGGARTAAARYLLSSLPADPRRLGAAARAHWAIENGLHWTMDVAFGEDRCRVRSDGAATFALLRRLTHALLKADTTVKAGIAARRKTAGWNDDYLLSLLLT